MYPGNFDNILNFRDVGTTINTLTNSQSLKPNLIYRSARPDTATIKDRDRLTSHYHICTIIDLRSKTEHINAAKKHADTAAIPPVTPERNTQSSKSTTPLAIPNITYKYISINGPAFERALLRQLSWSSTSKLLGLMAFGYRNDAIAILGREVMQPRGLIGLGMDTLDHSMREIKQVFDVLADKSAYPVVIHCTQGKDRTGLIVMLALLLCNTDQGAVERDYQMSEKELEAEKEERMKEISRMGMDESFAACPAGFVEKMVEHLDQRYGGVQKYLLTVGVGSEQQRKVKDALLQSCDGMTNV